MISRKDRIIITCGTFDPLSNQELNFLKRCRSKGDWLIVGVHSDWWMAWSEGGYVQDYPARKNIIQHLKCVDEVFTFNDSDGTVCQLLKIVKICYPHADITYISEEDMHNMPETKIKGINFETMK
jgi:cytidyltransferase-like protein